MDPENAWNDFMLAILEERREDASNHAKDLKAWFDNGGFMPRAIRIDPRNGRVRTEAEIRDYVEMYADIF